MTFHVSLEHLSEETSTENPTVDNLFHFLWLCYFDSIEISSVPEFTTNKHSPLEMETVILPCKTITPKLTEFSQNPPKTKISFKDVPRMCPLSITDAHLNYLCKNGRLGEAIASLDSIAQCGSTVSPKTFSYLIQCCVDSQSIHLCRKLHSHMKNCLKKLDPSTETKIIGMYAKCGSIEDAYKLFDRMRDRNLYTWSSMIGAFSRDRKWREVVELFCAMMTEDGIFPDAFLFPKILQACGNCGDVETGRLIHALVIKGGMNVEIRVSNAILAVYAKCGRLDLAKIFFHGMEFRDIVSWNSIITGYCQKGEIDEASRLPEIMRKEGLEPSLVTWNILISCLNQLGKCDVAMGMMKEMEKYGILPDVFTWTSMISGLSQSNRKTQALVFFEKMLSSGVQPNEVTLISLISMCASLKDLRKGRELHAFGVKAGFSEDVLVENSLVDMYSKCERLEAAQLVFDMISAKDVYSWNSIIAGYCQAGYCGKAHDTFMKMKESDVLPNVITLNAMITGFMQNGDEDQAMDLFQQMEADGHVKRDTATWNALIAGYLQTGKKDKALGIFRQMQSVYMKFNTVTILSTLPACANLIAWKKVKEIHCCVLRKNLESELSVANSLIDTYAKSGNINYSRAIFDSLPYKDIITWNTLIAGYVLHGRSRDAIELFEPMKNVGCLPNRGTFVGMILAYALAGMVDEGKRAFTCMTKEYHISPCLDHCAAMVNLFGCSGKLEAALDFINNMSIEPNSSIWSALLTASRVHGIIRLAVYAGERLLELEPENALVHRLVLQLYALSGTSDHSLKLKRPTERKDHYLGWSWTEDKNTVYSFVAAHHQQNSMILNSFMKSFGVRTMGSSYSYGLEVEEDNEETSGLHSEKLAIAFALTKSSGISQCIRIVKNTRMCSDCHRIAKLISSTHGCEIYLRDSKCLHHFHKGNCSCSDYW